MIEKTNKTVPVSAEKPAVDASEALLFSILLTIIGGFFETYSYVARDHVFANGQTGNMARLGMNLAAGDFGGAFKYLIPIVCFALGVYFAEMVKTYCERHNLLHWKQAILLIEILLTVITALVPNEYNTAANVLIGVLCGLQMEAFRRLKTYAYNSTMCTGNLRSATEAFYRFFALRQPVRGQQGNPLLRDHRHLYPQCRTGQHHHRAFRQLCHPVLCHPPLCLPVDSGPEPGYPPVICP